MSRFVFRWRTHIDDEHLAAPRLYATISVDNTRSMAVAEKLGLRWEATMRGRVKSRGRSWDMHLYVIEREDWLAQQP